MLAAYLFFYRQKTPGHICPVQQANKMSLTKCWALKKKKKRLGLKGDCCYDIKTKDNNGYESGYGEIGI